MKINNVKYSVFIVLGLIGLFSCNNGAIKADKTQVPDGHNAQNSLDCSGTYSGNLPCADCDYIDTELTLYSNLTYVLISKYAGKVQPFSDTLSGSFVWRGNNVKLEGIIKDERPSMFKIEENQVRHLDMEGKIITGDLAKLYVMKKNGNYNVEDKRWQLIELNGKPVNGKTETHYLIFHSEDGRLEAKLNCNVLLNKYKIKNELQLMIMPGISTKMACPDNVEQEFSKMLSIVDNLSTNGKTLSLNKARMAPLARFELVLE